MISPKPNSPMATATKPSPSVNSGMPKLKRSTPDKASVLICPSSRPSSTMPTALITDPEASTTAPTIPTSIKAVYSAGPKANAMPANAGAKAANTRVPTQPAKNEPSPATASAGPARP